MNMNHLKLPTAPHFKTKVWALLESIWKSETDVYSKMIEDAELLGSMDFAWESPIHASVQLQNTKALRKLINAKCDIHVQGKYTYNALFHAAYEADELVSEEYNDNTKVVMRMLIAAGLDINEPLENGYTVLHVLAKFGHVELGMFAVNENALIDAVAENGKTPLAEALLHGNLPFALYLISQGADREKAKAFQYMLTSSASQLLRHPLYSAMVYNDEETCEKLLKLGHRAETLPPGLQKIFKSPRKVKTKAVALVLNAK